MHRLPHRKALHMLAPRYHGGISRVSTRWGSASRGTRVGRPEMLVSHYELGDNRLTTVTVGICSAMIAVAGL